MDIDQIPLIGGHLALDFVNTVEWRGSGAQPNYLADYKRLAHWCARVGLISPSQHADVLDQAKQHPITAARIWREAMELRECLNHIVRALANFESPANPAIAAFNKTLRQAFHNRRLLPSESGEMRWSWSPTDPGLKVSLWEIALSAAELTTDTGDRRRIKICANGPCDWMFLDTSRSGRRRWCRMAVCGNTSKVRRFRERQRSKW